ncbi:MAG: hypothetical protein JNM31_15730 [Flavobacteriales bacterium]|nr:hypothetical protein [Flavobacteriales bacterium]
MRLPPRVILPFVLALHGLMAMGQWDLPVPLQLVGDSAADRQVIGLGDPLAPTDGLSAAASRNATVISGTTAGSNTLSISLTPTVPAYVPGMHLLIIPTVVNTGPATLSVDALPAVPLLKYGNQPLDSADLRPGIPADVVYDGAAFQWINPAHPACPPGYFPISREVCVQSTWNDPLNFYSANTFCGNRNARLCTMGEWYRGCAMPGGFLPTMTELEWVDHAANDTNLAKNVGYDSVNGLLGCKYGGHSQPLGLFRFRCCYDR